jgi:hypothetical protein
MSTDLMPLEERYERALQSLTDTLLSAGEAKGEAETLEAVLKQKKA